MTSRGGFWGVSIMFSDMRSVLLPVIGSKLVVTSGGAVRQLQIKITIAVRSALYAFMLPKSLSLPVCPYCSITAFSFQPLNANIAKLDWIAVAGEAERAGYAVFSGVRMVGHEIRDFAEVGVQNERSIEFHFDGRAFYRHFFEIPFADRALIAAM